MKKGLVAVLALVLMSPTIATTIDSQNITLDLEENSINNRVSVQELTSTNFTYSSSHPVNDLDVSVDGEEKRCVFREGAVGGEISCDVDQDSNFTVEMNYTSAGLVSDIGASQIFTYTESVVIPTDRLNLRVFLPEGSGVVDPDNSSRPVISPETGITSSDGQRIFVEWYQQPDLGETIEYHIVYQELSDSRDFNRVIAIIAGLTVLLLAGYMGIRYFIRQEIEDLYEDLDEDEIEVVETLVEHEGSMLQKDLVDESGYSKAKVSGTVSSLVDKDILEKEKEGRSNKLSISRRFSF